MSFGWRRFPGGTVCALCDGTGPDRGAGDRTSPGARGGWEGQQQHSAGWAASGMAPGRGRG